jgi:hypothetical protein
VAVVELFEVEVKVRQRQDALGAIPGIGEQNSTDVPKNGANGRQSGIPPRESF